MDKTKKQIIRKSVAVGTLLVVFAVLCILKTNQDVCEFFATTFSRAWIFIFGHVFGWLPLSVYELFLIAVIICVLLYVVFLIKYLIKKSLRRALSLTLTLAVAVTAFLAIYTATASFSYNRKQLDIPMYDKPSDGLLPYDEALSLAQTVIRELNDAYGKVERDSAGNVRIPYGFSELSDKISVEYAKLDSAYFSPYTPPAKKIINKTIMSEMHIVGVFFAPTGEANINGNETSYLLPHTMAHELAHSKGVMRESDANLLASYILLLSEDVYLRYSALMYVYGQAISLVRLYPNSAKDVENLGASVNNGVSKEKVNYSEYWSQFTFLDNIGQFFNDIYLKLNGQSGTGSYYEPPITPGTGGKDDYGDEILQIVSYSNVQNLIIQMYLDGRL